MGTSHLKRIATPNTWSIRRKEFVWVSKPKGAHALENGLPIAVAMKEFLALAKTNSEVKKILSSKTVNINGKKVFDIKRTFGILDVLSIKEIKKNYTLVLNSRKKLDIKELDDKEADFKISKIIGKTSLGKNKFQLNLHDGINVLVDKDDYKVGDSLVLNLADYKIKDKLSLSEKAPVYILRGKHTGKTGVVEKIDGAEIMCNIEEGTFQLAKNQVVVVGKTKPLLSVFKLKTSESDDKSASKEKKEAKSSEKKTKSTKAKTSKKE
ncbi:MAG: hypothetical protein ACLFPQ_03095 [Candidatus Woesearchaeota archaeon]